MAKELTCIFQDCLDCGDLAIWYALNTLQAKKHNVAVKPVHYQAIDAYGEMKKARKQGVKSYPFFTDGEKYAKNIEEFFKKEEVVVKKPTRKTKKEAKDGVDAKA